MYDYKIIVEQEHQTVKDPKEAQLSQREKQYEYYRNKLLTFE
jgi:restriction endonuclease S subunit